MWRGRRNRGKKARVRAGGTIFARGFLALCVLIPVGGTDAQNRIAPHRTDFARARRIALILEMPLARDLVAQKIIVQERSARRKKPSRSFRDLLNSLKSKDSEEPRAKGHSPKTAQKERAAEEANVSPAILRTVAAVLFTDALAARLHERLGMTVVPMGETQAALDALCLSPAEVLNSPAASQRLCARLGCDGLAGARLEAFDVKEGAERKVTLRIGLRAYVSSALAAARLEGKEITRAPRAFSLLGASSAGHLLFKTRFARTRPEVAGDAAQQAAELVAHTLATGEISPFARPDVRLALAPVPAPTRTDTLLFLPEGRRVVTARTPVWQMQDVLKFAPDLSPMPETNIVGSETTRAMLLQTNTATLALWSAEETPDTARVRVLARSLGAEYVLLARVMNIEVDAGPPDNAQAGETLSRPASSVSQTIAAAQNTRERTARAEVVGALIQADTGALLWHSHADATMTARSARNGKPIRLRSEVEVTRDAIRFALLQLQRDFDRYRAGFLR